MLSDQLIKNNTIALTELAKNSYDADASWVQIRIGNMDNFGKKNLDEKNKPFVEIEDDGDGMSFEIIRDYWMNPASPNKFLKRLKKDVRTRKNRIIQGEKGIGRYAVFQIGKKVEIFSRKRIKENKGGEEVNLITDLSGFTDELLHKKSSSSEEPIYFDQLVSKYNLRDDPVIIKEGELIIEGKKEKKKDHGTLIRITELNYKWNIANLKKVRKILSKLQSPFRKRDFAVSIVFEGEEITTSEDFQLKEVLDEALLEFSGDVNKNGKCKYKLKKGSSEVNGELDLVDNLKEDKARENRFHFFDESFNRVNEPQCGPFSFKYFVYDILNIDDIEFRKYVREHRTYIYRDDIRVYPYGDQDNDWLKLDIYRGVLKASYYLSNDQTIGYVNISSEDNSNLRDKTNREGIVERGTAFEDLRLLNLSALNFLHNEYQMEKMKPNLKPKRRKERVNKLYLQTEKVEEKKKQLEKHLEKVKDEDGKKILNTFVEDYYQERSIYQEQIDIVEDLAGVGLAVDATSHDIMVVMDRAREKINEIYEIAQSSEPNLDRLKDKIDAIRGQILFIHTLLIGIQPLFRSARRNKKKLYLVDILKTVIRYYETPIKKVGIDVKINEIGSPFETHSSEGVLLQIFINLMDNAVYWLKINNITDPKIEVQINGNNGHIIFADNGPGIKEKYKDYLFEPFFSTKGIKGRGLGLYIARKLADKYEYDLYYLENKNEKILPGANFRIDFIEQE